MCLPISEKDNYVIGYIIFWIKNGREGHIISIAVDKNYRRLGVGSKLLSRAINVLSLLEIDKVMLEVNENNNSAVEFYKSFKFRIDRIVPNYYENQDGAIVMYLPTDW